MLKGVKKVTVAILERLLWVAFYAGANLDIPTLLVMLMQ